MSKVYLLFVEYRYEGDELISAHATIEGACAAGDKAMSDLFRDPEDREGASWDQLSWGYHLSVCGSSWKITAHEVQA